MLAGEYVVGAVHECPEARERFEEILRKHGYPAQFPILDDVIQIPEYDEMRDLWYLDGGECLHWIRYCPYCGADLFGESAEA